HYKAFLSLRRAAARPTTQRQLDITKVSAGLLGTNLADLLRPTEDDELRYGIVGAARNVRRFGLGLITAVKAFRLGLTNSVILPAFLDDPHRGFSNRSSLQSRVRLTGRILDTLMTDLNNEDDPVCTGSSLGDSTVITVHGDSPKTPFRIDNWADGMPRNSNYLYVLGNGYLKTGWFGQIRANGDVDGFDPTTGDLVPGQRSSVTAAPAAASALYAVAKGDMQRVRDFYDGPDITGLVNETPST
ncbi:MAG: hypothetical protein AAGA56_17255, partial [Myxococcota bacterium]